MKSTSPDTFLGGTWKRITDRFLYCADDSGSIGGSKKITVNNLPTHNHTFTGDEVSGSFDIRACADNNYTLGGAYGVFTKYSNSTSYTWNNSISITPEVNELDKVLTLSTCYNELEKVVLHAKLIKIEEK